MCVLNTHTSHKEGSGPLVLELWMVVNHQVGSGKQNNPLQEQQEFLTRSHRSSPSTLVKQGLLLHLELAASAPLAGEGVPGIHLHAAPQYLDHNVSVLGFDMVLGIELKSLCFHGRHCTEASSRPC